MTGVLAWLNMYFNERQACKVRWWSWCSCERAYQMDGALPRSGGRMNQELMSKNLLGWHCCGCFLEATWSGRSSILGLARCWQLTICILYIPLRDIPHHLHLYSSSLPEQEIPSEMSLRMLRLQVLHVNSGVFCTHAASYQMNFRVCWKCLA